MTKRRRLPTGKWTTAEALAWLESNELKYEVEGEWLYCTSYPTPEQRATMKEVGWRYAPRKKEWLFIPSDAKGVDMETV